MSKVDEAWLQDVERRVAQVSQPGALDPFFTREVGALIEALRQERAQVAVLTEALQAIIETVDADRFEPRKDLRLIAEAALSATAGTDAERAGKLEALVGAVRKMAREGYTLPARAELDAALRDLDATNE